MKEFLQFAILGLGLSAIYSLIASGIVLVYRGAGVVNFAHGAFALVGAIVYSQAHAHGLSALPALILAVLAGGVLGLLTQTLVMRPLTGASALTRLIATLALLIIIEAAANLHYSGQYDPDVPNFLPISNWHFLGLAWQKLDVILIAIAFFLTLGLWVLQSRTRLGLATRAAAENETAVAALGWSPNRLATASWVLGGALAGLAGALIVPVSGLVVATLVLLIVPALAAVLLGGFDSFWGAFAGACLIGIGQSLIIQYVPWTGAGDALPFLVIIAVMIVTGRAVPARSHVYQRLQSIGSGIVRPGPVALLTLTTLLLMLFVFNVNWLDAVTVSISVSTVLLSIVVLTGYAGQVSLAQYAIAGLGAFIAGRLAATTGVPFWACFLIGVIGAAPLGALCALPALRTRGVSLAVITLGIAVAINSMLFNNVNDTGGLLGTDVGFTHLFGLDIDAISHPERYAIFAFVLFLLAALAVANVRRGSTGRRMIAIRENERAAASLGIPVVQTKLVAFSIAAAIAAIGGIVIAFRNPAIIFTNFDPLTSINLVGYAVIGGFGSVVGPLAGSVLADGGIGSLLNGILSGINQYLVLIGGVALLVTVVLNPDGIVSATREGFERAVTGRRWWRALTSRNLVRHFFAPVRSRVTLAPGGARPEIVAKRLEVRDLTVRFGGVVAVNGVSLEVNPGEIVGLIGPNGAGKTTFIDAVTGFVRSSGQIALDDQNISRAPAYRRVHLGVARSWQSLELFEDVTIGENMQAASESRSYRWFSSIKVLVRPKVKSLTPTASAAITQFGLADDLDRLPADLSYAQRRLAGIARAVSLEPSVLLLDEPASGLGGQEARELGSLVSELAKQWGMGILLIEHDVDLVMSVCDRIVVLDFGNVIASGTPEEVRNNEEVVAAYLGGPAGAEGLAGDATVLIQPGGKA
jgi:ABC-type branched-subunit amino acid transport system ATPase component/ABC-type branched-subunit amino acid transport system permease subunit